MCRSKECRLNQVAHPSGEEALRLINGGERVDLLVTDHLIPRMTGTELIREVHATRPALPALTILGYSEREGIEPDLLRLTKPFRQDELATSLERVMDGSSS
jgi:CheY-like chemotaxis protein